MRLIRGAQTGTIIWAIVMVVAIALFAMMGLNQGIDFTGGTLLERAIPGQVSSEQVRTALDSIAGMDMSSAVIQPLTEGERSNLTVMIIRTGELTNDQILLVDDALATEFGEVENRRTEVVGPVVGGELVRQSVWAVVLSAIGVLIYLSLRFEYRFGIAAVLAVLHDVLVVLTALALMRTEINTPFVAAILTVVGYSLNNTIVIFDRIRENLGFRKKESLVELANRSVVQTLSRTINTTISTLLVLVALLIWGGPTIRDFTLTLLLGIGVGTISSIFYAPSLWLILHRERSQSATTRSGVHS